jgi:dTDP-4-amino-4,6-dideoxygalactose transaminase
MVTTQRAEIDDITRSLRDHGASQSDLARHTSRGGYLLPDYDRLGYNFRMTDIQGALGSVQMDRAEWILSERSRCASLYDALLADVQWLRIPATPDGYVHGYQGYVCLFQPEEATFAASKRLNERRNRVMSAVEAKGIATRQGTHAPVTQGYYVNKYGLRPDEFPQACVAERLSLTLPLYAGMESADQETVVAELMRAFEESF